VSIDDAVADRALK